MKNLSRRDFVCTGSLALGAVMINTASGIPFFQNKGKRIGIIGLDTSHAIAFTKSLHGKPEKFRDYKVVAAYPYGTRTIPSATDRIPKYIADIKKLDVKVVDSIKTLLKEVDYVLLETNDGRLHLDQAREVFKAKKPLFIDKPLAASYKDAEEIMRLSKEYSIPFFSSSSLRYISGMKEILEGKYGKVLGADVYSPATIEPSHLDFFWYGIHAVEMLITCMGVGCKMLNRTHTDGTDIIVGVWEDGRVGTVRGTRTGTAAFGGTVYCEKGVVKLGDFLGYEPLLEEIVSFFDSGEAPVDEGQTLEICAFIEAADLSKKMQGRSVNLTDITLK
ncbi:Gfo/Idh/MocA family protein [Sphingobacterium faecale]|uniref:Gfo/Idh/MocA family oxidoreductase n=1 Tax=Sphingobacterium faecale TaxID=2803775 RepID=A0ABS1R302_9SPHI|nr:Gfo/Idh/MocA family oxidoreductase [Sphingobacterium faecale]MBL1408655.1 Gfo/Idh/MocA family oxidoreductase [Sphingobacterium faecale]